MNFLSDALGNDGIAKIAGAKVGEMVEDTLKKALGGDDKKEAEKGGAEGSGEGGFGLGDALSLVGGKKEEDKGGFGIGDALSLVGGKKEEDKGGFGIGDALSLVGGKKEESGGGGGLDVKNGLGGLFG
ncbi:uncharacterized protein LOC133463770 [Cololabis saira]|uniref:uncharacterized protein LOC133463770 n=1 Tax=Cololabis saira TaxID=129043 RepID=UPI002AD37186|nr:uncharacterized protein LOC133463770 [Cololabis saira]